MRGARPERALETVVRAALPPLRGERVVVACSGGPDSVALASLLDRVGRADGFDVVLAHVNHAVRAGAEQDECVALSVAARLGRALDVVVLAPPADDEATLRDLRYAALADSARRLGARYVATGHTAEDQTETVLLALFRGTGLRGLAGMAQVRPLEAGGAALLRPLLRATHADLLLELRRSGLPYARDPSNEDGRYRRSAVRDALAELRDAFPQLDRSVARCAHIVRTELDGGEEAAARFRVREALRAAGELRDVPFERIEAALAARPGRRVFVKRGVDVMTDGR